MECKTTVQENSGYGKRLICFASRGAQLDKRASSFTLLSSRESSPYKVAAKYLLLYPWRKTFAHEFFRLFFARARERERAPCHFDPSESRRAWIPFFFFPPPIASSSRTDVTREKFAHARIDRESMNRSMENAIPATVMHANLCRAFEGATHFFSGRYIRIDSVCTHVRNCTVEIGMSGRKVFFERLYNVIVLGVAQKLFVKIKQVR